MVFTGLLTICIFGFYFWLVQQHKTMSRLEHTFHVVTCGVGSLTGLFMIGFSAWG
jgi:hypothetical protein